MRKAMVTLLGIAASGALVLTGCGSGSSSGSDTGNAGTSAPPPTAGSTGGSSSAGSYKIGLLLPETTTARYETKDKPYFTEALKQICPDCQLLYANANSSASTQQQQAESMLTEGAKVLVVDPFDGVAAASIVSAAKSANVPVVAYDRLIHSPDLAYVVSNDYVEVGKLQGKSLVECLKNEGVTSGGILMINGATTDNNALNIKKGARSEIDPSGLKILSDTSTWDPSEARTWVDGQITRFGNQIKGMYSANDNNGASAIAAFQAAGWSKDQIAKLCLTGLDASQQGLQNIIAGLQHMTTYNAFKLEATKAAEAALAFAQGKTPESNGTVDGHPAFLNPPQAVTIDNIQSTVLKDGFWKYSDLCTGQYKAECDKAGLKPVE